MQDALTGPRIKSPWIESISWSTRSASTGEVFVTTAVKVTWPLFWTTDGVAVFVTAIDGRTSTISTLAVASSLAV